MWPKEAVQKGVKFLAEGGNVKSLSQREKENLGFDVYTDDLSEQDAEKCEDILEKEWDRQQSKIVPHPSTVSQRRLTIQKGNLP